MEHNNTKFDNEDSKAKKVMMLGDAGSGMTCMLLAYKDNKTPDFDSYYSRQWDGQRKYSPTAKPLKFKDLAYREFSISVGSYWICTSNCRLVGRGSSMQKSRSNVSSV
jgi:GTPase SAR1 family protein